MKKTILDLTVKEVERISEKYVLLTLQTDKALPEMLPGQFVEVRADGGDTFLRRPISIHQALPDEGLIRLLVAVVGKGTRRLAALRPGDSLNCVLPLGNSFTLPESVSERPLLVGGGVGVAPLLFLGTCLKQRGITPVYLLGARTAADLLRLDAFRATGDVFVTTEDGSAGEKGYVTQHSLLRNTAFSRIYTCGPMPMMKAVAGYARKAETECEASLENRMACGLGACLCCVEKTTEGNLCVCTEGPVFNVRRLLWQI